jgi:superfamily II DNA or RNA helicase
VLGLASPLVGSEAWRADQARPSGVPLSSGGRDPRRLFSPTERAAIAARQHHLCGVCERDLPEVFHVHHVVPWISGGPTRIDNGMAVCPDCHHKAPILALPGFAPREWQDEGAPRILPILRHRGFATLAAAPGAGKTLFAGWTFLQLADTADVGRVVWFVPNRNLRRQVKEELTAIGVYLDTDSVSERRDRDGVILTYHVLSDPGKLQQIIRDAEETPTLFVLDEVHHLAIDKEGKTGMWAWGISRVVGTRDEPLHAVLNMSGTPFRSDESERINTIRYMRTPDGRIDVDPDFTVDAGRLIREGHLRHIKVLAYDAEMRVQAVDLRKEATPGGPIRAVDLDGDRKLQSSVGAAMIRDPMFIDGVIREKAARLGHASAALGMAPVKGLFVVDNKDHADQVFTRAADILGVRHVFLAHADVANADDEIERFRTSQDQGILVAVRKITEGFDCPDVCVLTYLGLWRAPLFISQMAARAMRVTQRERELTAPIPATIIIPNIKELKTAFADILVGSLRVLEVPPEPCARCGQELYLCTCQPLPRLRPDKICGQCKFPWRHCVCPCTNCGLAPSAGCACRPKWASMCGRCSQKPCVCISESGVLPDIELLTGPELSHINVDGYDVDLGLAAAVRDQAKADGLDEVHAEQFAFSLQKMMEQDPMTFFAVLHRGEESDSG